MKVVLVHLDVYDDDGDYDHTEEDYAEVEPCPFVATHTGELYDALAAWGENNLIVEQNAMDEHFVKCEMCQAQGPVCNTEIDAVRTWNAWASAVKQEQKREENVSDILERLIKFTKGNLKMATYILYKSTWVDPMTPEQFRKFAIQLSHEANFPYDPDVKLQAGIIDGKIPG